MSPLTSALTIELRSEREAAPAADAPLLVLSPRRRGRAALHRVLGPARATRVFADPASGDAALVDGVRQGHPYALALVDARRSVGDPFGIVEAIRRRPELSNTPIVLLLASGRRGDAARCNELGVAGYLTKPLRARELVAAIETVLHRDWRGPAAPLVTRHLLGGPPDRLRILLAEDDAAIRFVATRVLEKRGHSVVATENGVAAVEALAAMTFDVLVTDVEMPGLDGVATLRAVREREGAAARRLPVIALTGHSAESDRRRLLEAGMDGWVAKPFQAEDLFFTVESAAAGRPAQRSGRAVPVPPAFDRDALLTEVGGDLALLERMLDVFRAQWPQRLRQLRGALLRRSKQELAEAAHALKGSAGTFRAGDAFETARRLETLSRSGDFAAAEETARALEERLRHLEWRLRRLLEEGRK